MSCYHTDAGNGRRGQDGGRATARRYSPGWYHCTIHQKDQVNTQFCADQFSDAYPPGIEQQYWHLARNRILEKHLRALRAKRVLDVGCGRGILVEYLIARGMDAYGVELAPVKFPGGLESRLFAGVTAESLAESFRTSVDTLVLGDVIEHLPDPAGYLQRLLSAFERADALLITVPARQEVWSNYDEYYGHYRRYDLAGLRATIMAIGFTPIELGYLFRFLYPPALLLRSLGMQRPVSLAAPRLPFLHRIIALAMQAEYRLSPRWIPGTSAICVAVRRGHAPHHQ